MTQYVLMDIEGTTTAIDFVHKTLFPYAREHMARFLELNAADGTVQACLQDVAQTVKEESGESPEDCCAVLVSWIDNDRKHPALKKLQGMIWKAGYRDGAYTAHLYDDVLPAWKRWRDAGLDLGIYSSGSVQAQKLLFAHTDHGDLNPFLSHYFDTGVGHKREKQSYVNIVEALAVDAAEILFLSDVTEELDAAREAGLATVQLVRPGTVAGTDHTTAEDFTEILCS